MTCDHSQLVGFTSGIYDCPCGKRFHVFPSSSPLYNYSYGSGLTVTVAVPLDKHNGIIGDGIVLGVNLQLGHYG